MKIEDLCSGCKAVQPGDEHRKTLVPCGDSVTTVGPAGRKGHWQKTLPGINVRNVGRSGRMSLRAERRAADSGTGLTRLVPYPHPGSYASLTTLKRLKEFLPPMHCSFSTVAIARAPIN